jgi:hypothetical protein
MNTVSRYHPLLAALHWLLALLLIAALALGALVLVNIPNSSPMKIEALRSHMEGRVGRESLARPSGLSLASSPLRRRSRPSGERPDHGA